MTTKRVGTGVAVAPRMLAHTPSVPESGTRAADLGRYDQLLDAVADTQEALLAHPIYEEVRNTEALRTFMEAHVFAVWDFMSLLKALQVRLSCVTVPWTPPKSRLAARLVNEIVLGEETDRVADGLTLSHYELYCDAMHELGADVAPITAFVRALEAGLSFDDALDAAPVGEHVRDFVRNTLAIATTGSPHAIAAAFLVGREDLVPEMFKRLLPTIEKVGSTDFLKLYLARHIELDEGEHGPMARRLLSELCGDDEAKWAEAEHVARECLRARHALWDGVSRSISGATASEAIAS